MTINEALSDIGLKAIIDKVLHQRGIDLRSYKINFLKRRIDVRMKARGLSSYTQYLALLNEDPNEYAALFEALSINVTEFFRDRDVFQAFERYVIPQLASRVDGVRELQVWSAGCATGEEAYSIAMMLSEARKNYGNLRFRIIATDVNPRAIEAAKEGKYPTSIRRNIPPQLLAKYFEPLPDGKHYQVREELRKMITFNVGNLASVQAPQNLDVVFCRNVMMYFDRELQDKLLTKFHKALKPYGYLILGKSETIMGPTTALFESVMSKERIYRKRNVVSPT